MAFSRVYVVTSATHVKRSGRTPLYQDVRYRESTALVTALLLLPIPFPGKKHQNVTDQISPIYAIGLASRDFKRVFRLAAATRTSTTACCATLGPVATRAARANQKDY